MQLCFHRDLSPSSNPECRRTCLEVVAWLRSSSFARLPLRCAAPVSAPLYGTPDNLSISRRRCDVIEGSSVERGPHPRSTRHRCRRLSRPGVRPRATGGRFSTDIVRSPPGKSCAATDYNRNQSVACTSSHPAHIRSQATLTFGELIASAVMRTTIASDSSSAFRPTAAAQLSPGSTSISVSHTSSRASHAAHAETRAANGASAWE